MRSSIREPAVAGQFYDENPRTLRREVEQYLSSCKGISFSGKPIAIIAPHAGYVYSGRTAAKAFYTLQDKAYERAIIIAPSHRCRFEGLAYGNYDEFRTPLGSIRVDKEALAKIAKKGGQYINELERAHAGEHSLEVELPFLQVVQPGLPIVPFICGGVFDETADELSDALVDFQNENNLWVISSDFTHYGYSFGYVPFTGGNIAKKIEELDKGAIERILQLDYEGFRDYIDNTGATICGENPIKILLKTLQKACNRGLEVSAELLDYTTSGELTGDYSHCVSYAAIGFFKI